MDELKQEPIVGATAEPSAPNPEPAKKPGDVNGDGKVDFKDYVASAAKAVGNAYQEAADAVKEKAPEFAQKAKEAANEVKDAFVETAETVKAKAPEYAQKAKEAANDVKDAFVETAETVKAKAPEYVQKAKDAAGNVKEAFEDAFCHKTPEAPAQDATASTAPKTEDDTVTRI